MKHLKKYNESAQQWGGGSFNNDRSANAAAGGAPQQPNDPRLTTDAFDRIKSNIAMGQLKMQQLTKQIFKDTGWGSKITNNLDLEKLKVIHLKKDDNTNTLDLFIEFKFKENDQTYFGKFSNWGSFNNVIFKSNFLTSSTIYNKKVEAILKRTILKWFEPELGDYKLINHICRTWDSMGDMYQLKQNARIKVIDVQLENTKPMIHLKVGEEFRYITDIDYWYFKWWFDKIKPVKEEIKEKIVKKFESHGPPNLSIKDKNVELATDIISSLYTTLGKDILEFQKIVKELNDLTGISFEIPQDVKQAVILMRLFEEDENLAMEENDDLLEMTFDELKRHLKNIATTYYLKIHGNLDNLFKTGIFDNGN